MKWEKFKRERISLNYTVMLLPHSQKKAIHFKTPVWTFGLFFLGILFLTGTTLFFAGSRHQLKQVQQEKAQLEQEWELLAAQKEQEEQENERLRQARAIQEKELEELEQKTKDTLKELEELTKREDQIRQELGLGQIGAEGSENENSQESLNIQEFPDNQEFPDAEAEKPEDIQGFPDVGAELLVQETNSRLARTIGSTLRLASVDLPVMVIRDSNDFQEVHEELAFLESSLSEKTGQYDNYLTMITEQKEAVAAEAARREALRLTIVENALQFVGNAYVYGGNNPNTGVDCSGFTKYILGNTAGVYLNRTAASQSTQGKAVSVEEARPGDLVFYSNGSSVNHVAIYMGNGRVVHASNERVGITTSDMYYRTPVKIVNVLGD